MGAAFSFGQGGRRLFQATIVIVLAETIMLTTAHEWRASAVLIGLLAPGVPALSAMLVGIRSHAEPEIMAEQSARAGASCGGRARGCRRSRWTCRSPCKNWSGGVRHCDEMLRDLTGWT